MSLRIHISPPLLPLSHRCALAPQRTRQVISFEDRITTCTSSCFCLSTALLLAPRCRCALAPKEQGRSSLLRTDSSPMTIPPGRCSPSLPPLLLLAFTPTSLSSSLPLCLCSYPFASNPSPLRPPSQVCLGPQRTRQVISLEDRIITYLSLCPCTLTCLLLCALFTGVSWPPENEAGHLF